VDLKLAPQNCTIDDLRAIWTLADDAGFDGVWDFDHFNSIGASTTGPVFEGWTLLGAMAALTKRVRIGCMVTGVTYRHPAVLAKMAVTVDHLSNGRLDVGIGAAWAVNEHTSLGIPFPPNGPRIRELREACEVMKRLWTWPRTTYDGKRFTLVNAVAEPKPVQRPHPPLWIGGEGEKLVLRVVARHADVWNHTSNDPEKSARLSKILDEHCHAVGRKPEEIGRSVQLFYAGDRDGFLRLADGLVREGFTKLVCGVRSMSDGGTVAELLPRLRALG
jgi:F420-dependent oxidoreductase-like protein